MSNWTRRGAALYALAIALVVLQAPPIDAARAKHRIRFAPGHSSAQVKSSVLRGERNEYVLTAKAGQRMILSIRSLEKNAAFTVYPPGSARPLPATEEERDATTWTGKLPKHGDYVISVGSTRGNATYVLKVTIT
jgi:hypothetical protein